MSSKMVIDLETRSECDLRKSGVHPYAEHGSTAITHIGYKLNDTPTKVWRPIAGSPMPGDLRTALEDPAVVLVAHNSEFEVNLLTERPGQAIGVPIAAIKPLGRWNCTASRAAACGLPRSLEGAANALGLSVTKDKSGHSLMLQCCRPRNGTGPGTDKPTTWWEDEDRMVRLDAYCRQDCETEYALDKVLPPLSPTERRAWELTCRMNARGVAVDERLLVRVSLLIDDATRAINATIGAKTNGAVPKISNHLALCRWLAAQGIDDVTETGVGKAAVAAILENPDIDPLVREVLHIRQAGGGSSAAKYRALLGRLSSDGRIRNVLVYCGAAATGRWSSRGAQLHNLPRGNSDIDVEGAIEAVLTDTPLGAIEFLFGPPLIVASTLLRPVFIAGGE
jgi:DNA polymerase bacteriophage-type